MKFDIIIPAGGASIRMNGINKLALSVGDFSLLEKTVSCFSDIENIEKIIIGASESNLSLANEIANKFSNLQILVTLGGISRTQTVENCLKLSLSQGVLIHDGARPNITKDKIKEIMQAVENFGVATLASPIADTVMHARDGKIISNADRNNFASVATPQGFLTRNIKLAYGARKGLDFTDDTSIYLHSLEKFGYPLPKIIENDPQNIKITTIGQAFGLNSLVGIGYDIHNLIHGKKFVLCGVEIDAPFGTIAHSDGDAPVHALIDAILSAMGDTDIGTHFPNTDPKFLNISSLSLLSEIMKKLEELNKKIINTSIIINLDEPKLAPYVQKMKENMGTILKIPTTNVGITFKTTESQLENAVSSFASVVLN